MQLRTVRFAETRRGGLSGLVAVVLLLVAALPSRLACLVRDRSMSLSALESALAGMVLDVSEVVALLSSVILIPTLVVPLCLRRARTSAWQRRGALACAIPFGFLLWILAVIAQEFKFERGGYPTAFDFEEGANGSFLQGLAGYLRYESIWIPAAIGIALTVAILAPIRLRPNARRDPWTAWALGLAGGFGSAAIAVWAVASALPVASSRFTSAGLGNPLAVMTESVLDRLRGRGPNTARQLVLAAEFSPGTELVGAGLLGWPPPDPIAAHPHRRPLDSSAEPAGSDPRGRVLIDALTKVGEALLSDDDPRIAVFHLSLEGFRADDLHALNPAAPEEIAPFTNALYRKPEGVLASTTMYQAGVRTAHGLGAMTCGLGTLPYNLSLLRDLQPFPVRCLSDVLHDAGFVHSFFYGSDARFDGVRQFVETHGYSRVISQAELPQGVPLGTWDAATDFAVLDEATRTTVEALPAGPQFDLVMSLSNHSPFTAPEDLPREVPARVEKALATHGNRATADDKKRLIAYSYTDAALERFFTRLTAVGLAERSIIVLLADHSTGHTFVWGKDEIKSDRAKAQIPFAIVIPKPFLSRARDPSALAAALREAQSLLEDGPLSQNDMPSLLLAVLRAHPFVKAMPASRRWHTLGGQVTSPWFRPGGAPTSYVVGINGISELFVLNRNGDRIGDYEESIFLQSRADRYRVTPRLIPITATLIETMKLAK